MRVNNGNIRTTTTKKIGEEKTKRGTTVKTITPSMKKAKPYASYPFTNVLIPDNLFDSGWVNWW